MSERNENKPDNKTKPNYLNAHLLANFLNDLTSSSGINWTYKNETTVVSGALDSPQKGMRALTKIFGKKNYSSHITENNELEVTNVTEEAAIRLSHSPYTKKSLFGSFRPRGYKQKYVDWL